MLELVGVVVSDGGVRRLDRCSLAVQAGEVLGVIGPTGAGKSAVLEVACGLRAPDRGRVLLEGRDVTRRPGKLRAAAALMPHGPPGPLELKAGAWLALWGELDGVGRGERRARVLDVTERFGLGGLLDRPVCDLSHGQRVLLGAARLWVRSPPLFLLDGPAQGLDGAGLRAISAAIRAAAAGGSTVMLTAAAPHFPTSVCDRVVCLGGGAVTAELSRGEGFSRSVAEALGWMS